MLKVGDKVRVRNDLRAIVKVKPKLDLRGKIVTIRSVLENGKYIVEEDICGSSWSESMFEISKKFKPTDCIVILSDGVISKGYHKRNGKIVSQSETHKHPNDQHDLWYAAKTCLDRINEQEQNDTGYNGKVVCLESKIKYWTKGKIYQVQNGVVQNNEGGQHLGIKSFDELCDECCFAKWLEIVE